MNTVFNRNATIALVVISVAMALVLIYGMARPVGPTLQTIGAYATDLSGRTPHQQFNARRAASKIDGMVVDPGNEFSFNATVGGWSADRGYLKAPVSYDGVLIDDYGGGVCETSTTVYNAALLAGLTILERHPHTFAPSYAPVGRDAAVAYPGIDLRVRNVYDYPLTIHIAEHGRMLVCQFIGRTASPPSMRIVSNTTDIIPAAPGYSTPGSHHLPSHWRLQGRNGYRVVVYRQSSTNPSSPRELISADSYEPLSAVRALPG
jgi:vancomycin resistance protein VanW